ncbi:hypothetical protein [Dactylosporangium salmoneum]|uniref:Alpha/beta hydrolase n=1 Tax=Dactylosporangium salmoneum TaxID=53361 RepID=A0ABP5UQT1_9ACTN
MLCTETYGTPRNAPPIVLIGGASSSMDWWHPGFCTALAGAAFVPLPGLGHEVPPRPLWPAVISAVGSVARTTGH